MLVLSRRPQEAIVLPTLGVRLQVLRVQGNTVRLGIEAPASVSIVREELQGAAQKAPARQELSAHDIRNRLNQLSLGLHLASQLINESRTKEAARAVEKGLTVLKDLERDWAGALPEAAAPEKNRRRCRTLVVEDDCNERELLAGLMHLGGCECDSAPDGEAALQYLSTHERPDFVLLDMRMPRRNGAETLKEIRRDPRLRGVKVFAITGAPQREFNIETGPEGVDAWFSKPLNPDKLWEAMRRSLEGGNN